MAYYISNPRLQGGNLGGLFKILQRTLIPSLIKSAKPFLAKTAMRALPALGEAGIGLLADVKKKKSFKGAVKARAKRLASNVVSDLINQPNPTPKRHKVVRARKGNTSKVTRRKTTPNKKRKPSHITRDIFS